MPITQHHKLLAGEPFQTHRAAHMQLVIADADFSAQPILKTVCQSRGGIHHHRTRINLTQKTPRAGEIFGNNRIGVCRAVGLNMIYRLIQTRHHTYRQNRREIFGLPVFFCRNDTPRQNIAGARTAAQLHARRLIQACQLRQHTRRNAIRYQQCFHGVAGAITLRLGVIGNLDGLI